jgi:hypothetical protein
MSIQVLKISIKDKFLDIITLDSDTNRVLSIPYNIQLEQEELNFLNGSIYQYNVKNEKVIQHFKDKLFNKGSISNSSSEKEVFNKLITCGTFSNGVSSGVKYSLIPISNTHIFIELRVSSFMEIEKLSKINLLNLKL